MRAGSRKFRSMMARLDEAGITANIVRVGRRWYELHVNYRIEKAAKSRGTCNRHLVKLLDTHYPPPLQFPDTLKLQILMFFQQLIELDPKLDLQFRAMAKPGEDSITVSVTPASLKNIRPVIITGTAAELDAGLIDALRQTIQQVGGLTVSNAEAFQEDLERETAGKKPGTGKTAAPTKAATRSTTPAAKKDEAPKVDPKPAEKSTEAEEPAAVQAAEATEPSESTEQTMKKPESAAPAEVAKEESAAATETPAAPAAAIPAPPPPPPPPAMPARPTDPSDKLFS